MRRGDEIDKVLASAITELHPRGSNATTKYQKKKKNCELHVPIYAEGKKMSPVGMHTS